MSFSEINAPSGPLFDRLQILKLNDMFQLQVTSFIYECTNNIASVYFRNYFTRVNTILKPGLHIVVRVAEHACDHASKRILKPSTYRSQIFLVRDQYLRSLLPHGDQTIAGQLEKHVLKTMLAILTTHIESRLKGRCSPIYEKRFVCCFL